MYNQEIPFEIHLTTECLASTSEIDFVDFCLASKAKPLLIELSKGDVVNQPMLSKVVYGKDVNNILLLANELSISMKANHFPVKRLKIEIPADAFDFLKDYSSEVVNYFEWHCKVNYTQAEQLLQLCEKHKSHLSINSLRNERNIKFITLREFGHKLAFEQRIAALLYDMKNGNWNILKQQSEYCIYDNNHFLDNGWLPK